MNENRRRPIEWWERRKLENNGCHASDWTCIRISDNTDLDSIHHMEFKGAVSIGAMGGENDAVLENACLENTVVGDYATIRNVRRHIRNCKIGDHVRIEDVSAIEFEPEAMCGVGCEVSVLDETGSRSVTIYPGLSAQTASLMARMPKWKDRHFRAILETTFEDIVPEHRIGDHAVIENCGIIRNVSIGREVHVSGARSLHDGMIINNAATGRCLAFVGDGVDASNFIIEDGVVDSGAIIRNCYIGQGATIEKGFTAHDSLFFANCSLENGEACAMFAGPYTVSMHKATLLIGCQTSFMNAGSGTNQSNHMYKLGPVHWGLLERGVKTSSASYLMLGAKIGAFSLLMGHHKTHPDSSQFPFSYLFGDEKGATVVVPGAMLRSCGLLRDEQKWPTRDRRLKRKLPMRDRIIFDVLNPTTVDKMLSASEVIEKLLTLPPDDDRYLRYRGMKFTRAALERAKYLYALAIFKYLHIRLAENPFPQSTGEKAAEWVDISGLIMTRDALQNALEAESIQALENVFEKAFAEYRDLELRWIADRFDDKWKKSPEVLAEYASEFDRMVEEDRNRYIEDLAAQNDMLAL